MRPHPRKKWMLAAALAVLAGGGVWLYAGLSRAPRGNIGQALKTDLSRMDDQQILGFVGSLNLAGSTPQQRIDLFTRLKARFDDMSLTQKLSLLLSMRKVVQDAPNGPLVDNGRMLMQAYWNRELKTYIQAPPDQRQKMIDSRIDESLTYENLQNIQNAAKGLFGGKTGPSDEELKQMQTQVLHAVVDSMENSAPEDRAAATQYFMDMRARRLQRGLPVQF